MATAATLTLTCAFDGHGTKRWTVSTLDRDKFIADALAKGVWNSTTTIWFPPSSIISIESSS